MKHFLALTFICLALITYGQDKPVKKNADFSIRANWNYQFFTFSGKRTNSSCIGGIIEKRINYESTAGLMVNYITRMEDGELQYGSVPAYNEIIHISPFFRKYFDEVFKGPYAGVGIGIGIPSEKGVQWDMGGHFGYVIKHNNIAVDLMIQMGFGSFRYNEDQYTNGGIYVGSVSIYDYGFFFRPGLNVGFAF